MGDLRRVLKRAPAASARRLTTDRRRPCASRSAPVKAETDEQCAHIGIQQAVMRLLIAVAAKTIWNRCFRKGAWQPAGDRPQPWTIQPDHEHAAIAVGCHSTQVPCRRAHALAGGAGGRTHVYLWRCAVDFRAGA
eukprot:2903721-Pleurochrysis_carterae.AAC.9